jgi:uncharacterized membrane protein
MKKLLTAALLFLTFTHTAFAQGTNMPIDQTYVKAKVTEVREEKIQMDQNNPMYDPEKPDPQYLRIQNVTYEVLEGPHKGIIFPSQNEIEGRIFDMDLKVGDKVVILLNQYDDETFDGYATDYARNDVMIVLIVLFMVALIAIGKWKGLRALISLIITIGAIFLILIPYSIKGYNSLLLAMLISIAVTIATILIISGFNKKSLSAIIGTVGGLFFAVLIAYIVGKISLLTGLSGEDARVLYVNRPDLNFSNILFASIVIGALGAIMDVGMSISSSLNEMSEANPNMTKRELFKSGMNVGKDIMGTMSNTLILAYVGSAFPLLMLFYLNEFSLFQVINFDFMAAEIVRSISGSFGLLLAIPITALFGSIFTRR